MIDIIQFILIGALVYAALRFEGGIYNLAQGSIKNSQAITRIAQSLGQSEEP